MYSSTSSGKADSADMSLSRSILNGWIHNGVCRVEGVAVDVEVLAAGSVAAVSATAGLTPPCRARTTGPPPRAGDTLRRQAVAPGGSGLGGVPFDGTAQSAGCRAEPVRSRASSCARAVTGGDGRSTPATGCWSLTMVNRYGERLLARESGAAREAAGARLLARDPGAARNGPRLRDSAVDGPGWRHVR